MKIFYKTVDNGQTCINKCPYLTDNVYIGSLNCQNCKHCYGKRMIENGFGEYVVSAFDDNDKQVILLNQYIRCSAMFKEKPLSVKIRHFIYQLFNKLKKL